MGSSRKERGNPSFQPDSVVNAGKKKREIFISEGPVLVEKTSPVIKGQLLEEKSGEGMPISLKNRAE